MKTRRGATPIQMVLVIAALIIVGAGVLWVQNSNQSPINTTDTDTNGTIDQKTNETQIPIKTNESQIPQEYTVKTLIVNPQYIRSGDPIQVTAILEKISGEDPFPVSLYINGQIYEESQVSFGEQDEVTIQFLVSANQPGLYETNIKNARKEFEVNLRPIQILWISIQPENPRPNDIIDVSFMASNPNNVSISENILVEAQPEIFNYTIELQPQESNEFEFSFTRNETKEYSVKIGNKISYVTITDNSMIMPNEYVNKYNIWTPDPATWNMTNILPPEASELRLSMPVPIDSLYGSKEAGIGGVGLHAGGHIEGLDHAWIESTSNAPIVSWADGVITSIWEVEGGEFLIGINYGYNLTGVHMEIDTSLVEVGDNVTRGDPIGYGLSWFEDIWSAEFRLSDAGRRDGIDAGDKACVSPFDYLIEEERIELARAYIENIIEPWVETGELNGMFEPAQPYLTNPQMIHHGNEGRLQGEWFLISGNWTAGEPNDMITIIEADTPYFTGTMIHGSDDFTDNDLGWNFDSECIVNYTSGQISWVNWDDEKIFGIFEVDESEERAKLRLQYQRDSYPVAFTDEADIYIERSFISRREEAVRQGVLIQDWD
jgi:murein DD-endopeptidase MepM/ murein hydrolase activator NlpD